MNGRPPSAALARLAPAALAGAAWLALGWPLLRSLGVVYATESDYSHGLLVPLIAAWMAWERRNLVRQAPVSSRWPGLFVLALGAALVILARWYAAALHPASLGQVFLGGTGLLATLAGAVWLHAGAARMRHLAAPLVFLVFALPLPDSVVLRVTSPLQSLSVATAAAVLRAFRIPVHVAGHVLEIPGGLVGVGEACSGIRSLWVLAAAAFAMIVLLRLRGHRAALALLAVPLLAVGINLLRVIVSAAFVAAGRIGWTTGSRHTALGMATIIAAAALLFALGWKLAPRSRRPAPSTDPSPGPAPSPRRPLALAAGAVLAASAAAALFVEAHYARATPHSVLAERTRLPLAQLPEQIGPYRRIRSLELPRHELDALRPSDAFVGLYAAESSPPIRIALLYWAPQLVHPDARSSLKFPHDPDWCYPGIGWKRDPQLSRTASFPWAGSKPMQVRVFRSGDKALSMIYWRDDPFSSQHLFVPRAMGQRLRALIDSWRHPPAAEAHGRYGVTISASTTPAGQPAASLAVADFARHLHPLLADFGFTDRTPPR